VACDLDQRAVAAPVVTVLAPILRRFTVTFGYGRSAAPRVGTASAFSVRLV
jgi:hypothetical protein